MNWAALMEDGELKTFVGVQGNPNHDIDIDRVEAIYFQTTPDNQFIVAPRRELGESLGFRWLGEGSVDVETEVMYYFGRYWVPRIENPVGPVELTIWPRGKICVMATGNDEFVATIVGKLEETWQHSLQQ